MLVTDPFYLSSVIEISQLPPVSFCVDNVVHFFFTIDIKRFPNAFSSFHHYNMWLTKGVFIVFQLRDHCHTAEGQWSHRWRTIITQLRDE